MAREIDLRISRIEFEPRTKYRFMRALDLIIELMVLGDTHIGSVNGIKIIASDRMPENKVAFCNDDGEILGVFDLNEK